MENWDEVKTAFQVARMGTVSGAAEVLGVHHATVIRHIDAIEGRLGVKLFQRHARGYTPTEAGEDLLRVAQATEDQFNQLSGRIKGQGSDVSGELVVTSLVALGPLLTPTLAAFQKAHDRVIVRFLTGDRVFRLEYGEAHVAIRAGSAPDQPDNVVQPFVKQRMGLYASPDYIERFGKPESAKDFSRHRFVDNDNANSRAPFSRWLRAQVPLEAIAFRGTDDKTMGLAVREGAGIGFVPVWQATGTDLVEVHPSLDEWSAPLWLVTHVDLHRTTKVQAFLTFLKEQAKAWNL